MKKLGICLLFAPLLLVGCSKPVVMAEQLMKDKAALEKINRECKQKGQDALNDKQCLEASKANHHLFWGKGQ